MTAVGATAPPALRPTDTSPRASGPRAGGTGPGSGGTGPSAVSRLAAGLRVSGGAQTWLAIGVVIIVALLVVPLPPVMLDVLLATSIALSIVVLLVTLSTVDPIDFSSFPTLLLLLTLLRLGLNVSSARLILGRGYAGQVINAFGHFLIGGNFVVGLVIFLILVVINFMVITKGAGRIAEVAARFTLDAMPGKQMAIDADLGAGLIDEAEARRRRQDVARYADFYGAMDGAAKFVRGDAVACLVITAINLVGGFIIGLAQQGLTASESLSTYTTLTIGDGLVSQIPALIVSTAAGILVTYGASSSGASLALAGQLTRQPRALNIAAVILAGMAFLPGLPAIPFLLLAAGTGAIGWKKRPAVATAAARAAAPATPAAPAAAQMRELLQVEPLEVEIGYALIPLVDEAQHGDLLHRIGIVRRQVAVELGIVVPPARIRDNIQLAPTEYAIKLRGMKVAGGEIMPRYLLALDTTHKNAPIEGIRTTDPTFGMPAVWITSDRRVDAEAEGYNVVEAPTVLSTHLMETIRRHAGDILSRQDVRELVDGLRESHPALIDDLIPNRLPLGTLHRVLQRLLREGLPVRDLVTILETLADTADTSKDPEILTEHVRRALSNVVAQLYAENDGCVRGITIGPRLESALMQLFAPRASRDGAIPLEPDQLTALLRTLGELVTAARRDGRPRPLITPPALRTGVRRLVEPILPELPVISLGELPPQMPVQSLAIWEMTRGS
ncbi:MAG TPA: flagellar biosynthesis protein FlhA [Gemmatimonadales bacterium]